MYTEKSPSVARIAECLQQLRDRRKARGVQLKEWRGHFIEEISGELNKHQNNTGALCVQAETLKKQEAALDAKIAVSASSLKGQQGLMELATNFAAGFGSLVGAGKGTVGGLESGLRNSAKETEAYIQALNDELKTQQESRAAAEKELQAYQDTFGIRLSKSPDTSGAGKGTLNMKVRWYGPDGQERWTELDVRPDPFLGNEVRLRDPTEPGAKPKVFTGVDIARLVAMVATNKYREAMLEKGKK